MSNNPLLVMDRQDRTQSTINKISLLIHDIRELNPNLDDFEIWDIVLIAVDSMKRDLEGVSIQ